MNFMIEAYPELATWLKSKRKDWILAGLSQEKSKVPIEWWTFARSHTGISESSHFADNNFTGRQLSVLAAIMKYSPYNPFIRQKLTSCKVKETNSGSFR
jgi:hypothetical protein